MAVETEMTEALGAAAGRPGEAGGGSARERQLERLRQRAAELRRTVFGTICRGGGGHIPASLSIVEILTVLYEAVLRVDPARPHDPQRDRFILSKGHGCVALYAALAAKGFFPPEQLATYGQAGTMLGGHPDMHKTPGVEASTGSLGHGLAFGAGMALAGKLDKKDYRVFVLLGDGECQEGSVWEAALFAAQHKLDHLTAIIDYNQLQALDRLEEVVELAPLAAKWGAFGWAVREVDGHGVGELMDVLTAAPLAAGRPTAVVAHTIKGKGISFMENVPIWHYRLPDEQERRQACAELGMADPLEGGP